jgi:hypothetical protein
MTGGAMTDQDKITEAARFIVTLLKDDERDWVRRAGTGRDIDTILLACRSIDRRYKRVAEDVANFKEWLEGSGDAD